MRWHHALVLLAVLVAHPAAAQNPLSDANQAWRQGDLPRAAKLFSAAADAETDPAKRADIRVRLAWTYFLMKDRTAAEEALSSALADQPRLALAPDYYTSDFMQLFTRVKSRAVSTPAPPAAAPGAAGTVAIGLTALRQRLAQAVDSAAVDGVLTELGALEPNTAPAALPDLLDLKAEALERLGRNDEALEARGRVAALRAVAQAPSGTNPWPLDTLLEARRLLANGQPNDAAAIMRGVLKELPSCSPALEVMGEALLAAGRLDEAYGALQTALIGNESPELLMALGEVEVKRGRLASARNAFRRAVEADPENDRAWSSVGLIAARLDDRGGAKEALDKALQANGTLFEAQVVRAQLALIDGDGSGAAQHLQRALQVRPDDPWASGWLGVAFLITGNLTGAIPLLEKGYEANHATFALPLAELRRRLGRPDAALTLVANGGASARPEADIVRARCLIDLGRLDEATSLLRTAVSARPDDGAAAYLLGVALLAQRQWGDAADMLSRSAGLPGHPPGTAQAAEAARATQAAQSLIDAAQTVPASPARH